jgi:hypothetical protein
MKLMHGTQNKIAALAAIFFASFCTTEFFIAARKRLDFVPTLKG